MPRFDPDPQGAHAVTPVWPKGDYQLKIVRCRPRVFTNAKDQLRAAVDYDFELVGVYNSKGKLDKSDEGKPVRSNTLWLHTEATEEMNKRFLMAANGYPRTQAGEEAANEELFSNHTWFIDGEPDAPDSVECGTGYHECVGRMVNASLDVGEYDGEPQQEFRNFHAPDA